MTAQGEGSGRRRGAQIDFAGIAAAAKANIRSLLDRWLPDGHKVGDEWKSVNPTRSDAHEGSFSINLNTGAWGDFATPDAGGDLISLCAYLFHEGDQGAAARELAEELRVPLYVAGTGEQPDSAAQPRRAKPARPAAKPKAEPAEDKPRWVPVMPVPDHAGEPPKAHEFRGLPERVWTYRDGAGQVLGYICRFRTSDGGKEIAPLTWCKHEKTGAEKWSWVAFPEPRPLYGLDRLAASPQAPVLVVEGEKCADAAQAEMPDKVVVTWPGGTNAVDKADWSPLAGRTVFTFADADSQRRKLTKAEKEEGLDPLDAPFLAAADQPGAKAMAKVRAQLAIRGCRLFDVTIPGPGEKPAGWDVADMIDAGIAGEDLAAHIRRHAFAWSPPAPEEQPPPGEAPAERKRRSGSDFEPWRANLHWKKGEVSDCLANVHDVLANRREWVGVLGYDEFALRVVKLKPPPYAGGEEGEWLDVDDSRTAVWLTHQEGITPTSARVMEAITMVAQANPYHPVRIWLGRLPEHDGKARLDHWLTEFLGVADSPYVRKVARWYLVGMIARVMRPGIKFDTCLVLEGTQGKGKSTALGILAGEWFHDTDLDLSSKDAMASLQGVWLHEFAELGSLAKAEANKQKSFLSRCTDSYRPSYGRRNIKAPRQVAFAGSVNHWQWQKDPTGGRRFWPVLCGGHINTEGLAAAREQLFAEALAAWRAGERFWPTADEQAELFDPEQLQRLEPDSVIDALHDWVYGRTDDFSMAMAIMEGLALDASKLTRDLQTRVGIALEKLGCRRVERRNGMVRYWYRPPVRNEAESEGASRSETGGEGGHVAPF